MKAFLPLCLLLLLAAACCHDKGDVAPRPSLLGKWHCDKDSIVVYKDGYVAASSTQYFGPHVRVTANSWTDSLTTNRVEYHTYTRQVDTLVFSTGFVINGGVSDYIPPTYPTKLTIVELTPHRLHLRASRDVQAATGVYQNVLNRYFSR
jgi:hypothetical protein